MPDTGAPPRHSNADDEADLAGYRPVSTLAVLGLVVALLGPVAVIGPLLWAVPLVGIAINAIALWRISRPGAALVGRKAAHWGLAISLACCAAATSDWYLYRAMVRREARQFARQWFDYLCAGQPAKALRLAEEVLRTHPVDGPALELLRQASIDQTVAAGNWDSAGTFRDKLRS